MASKNREHHIIWTTPCPICKVPVGKSCDWTRRDEQIESGHGFRLAVHGERKKAWQTAGNPKTEHD